MLLGHQALMPLVMVAEHAVRGALGDGGGCLAMLHGLHDVPLLSCGWRVWPAPEYGVASSVSTVE